MKQKRGPSRRWEREIEGSACASLSIMFLPFSGVFHLHQGDILSVVIPRARAKLSLSPHGTFLGVVKL